MKPLYTICIAAAGACLVVFAFINADSAADQNKILAELFGGMALMVAGYTLYLLRDRRSYDGTMMHRHHHHHRHHHTHGEEGKPSLRIRLAGGLKKTLERVIERLDSITAHNG